MILNDGCLLDITMMSAPAPERDMLIPADLGTGLVQHDKALLLPSIAVADMAQDMSKQRRTGAAPRADRLDHWLDSLLAGKEDYILPLGA